MLRGENTRVVRGRSRTHTTLLYIYCQGAARTPPSPLYTVPYRMPVVRGRGVRRKSIVAGEKTPFDPLYPSPPHPYNILTALYDHRPRNSVCVCVCVSLIHPATGLRGYYPLCVCVCVCVVTLDKHVVRTRRIYRDDVAATAAARDTSPLV